MNFKKEGFNIPKAYFENLNEKLVSKKKIKDEGFNVPADYFKSFSMDKALVEHKLHEPEVKNAKLRWLKPLSIAASLLLVLGLGWFSVDDNSNYSEEQDIAEIYLEYLNDNPDIFTIDDLSDFEIDENYPEDEILIEYLKSDDIGINDLITLM